MRIYCPNRLTQAAAVAAALLCFVFAVLVPRVAEVATYLGFLVGCGALMALYTSFRLWLGGFDGRILGMLSSSMILAVQILNLVVGLPAAGPLSGQITPLGVVSLLLNVVMLAALTMDAARHVPISVAKRPYAL